MKRKSKNNEDLVAKILKGMVDNQKKVEDDLFAQRLKSNILRHWSKDSEMNVATLTEYLNSTSANKREIREEDVQREYDSWVKHDYEKGKLSNQVVSRMLYKGIKRLHNLISKDSTSNTLEDPEINIKRTSSKEILHPVRIDPKKEEEKMDIYKELGMNKHNSQQPAFNSGVRMPNTGLDDIDEIEGKEMNSLSNSRPDTPTNSKLTPIKSVPKDPYLDNNEEEKEELITTE